jgi:hypothetical protein
MFGLNNVDLYWVGPRRSDLYGIEHEFAGAVVIMGEENINSPTFHSLESVQKIRINHNDDANYFKVAEFYDRRLTKIISTSKRDVRFLWYSRFPVGINESILQRSPFNISTSLMKLFSNKLQCRMIMASEGYETLPSMQIPPLALKNKCTYENLIKRMPGHERFVVQGLEGSGGFTTYLMDSPEDDYLLEGLSEFTCLASPYIGDAWPINIHLLVEKDGAVALAPSIQIIDQSAKKLEYVGGDYAAAQHLPRKSLQLLRTKAVEIGKTMADIGYRGIAGVDFLLTADERLLFVEINPRFQGSSMTLNQALLKANQPSLQQLHLQCFRGERLAADIAHVACDQSFFSPFISEADLVKIADDSKRLRSPDPRESKFNATEVSYSLHFDGASQVKAFEPGAQVGRMMFNQPICGKNPYGEIQLFPSIPQSLFQRDHEFVGLNEQDPMERLAKLKFSLLVHGARVSEQAKAKLLASSKYLTIRDGIAGGLQIRMFKNLYVNVPIKDFGALLSMFEIDFNGLDFELKQNEAQVCKISLIPIPSFTGRLTQSGVAMEDVGQAFTDRLGLAPFAGCRFSGKQACGYCEIGVVGPSTEQSLADMLELLAYCRENEPGITHLLISGGTPSKSQWNRYIEIITTIKQASEYPMYLMTTPPQNLDRIADLKAAGVDELGLNMEVFDQNWAVRHMPGKGKLSRKHYLDALELAVSIWGGNGAVRSILIAGLEPLESTLQGVYELCRRNVMPILSPFTPIQNTSAAFFPAPTVKKLFETWQQSQKICESFGMSLGPACLPCQNNTLSMPQRV